MAVRVDLDRDRRLQAMGIDGGVREILLRCRPVIEKDLDRIIRQSYERLLAYPEPAKAYSGMNIEDACRAQHRRWIDEVFPATFSDEQLQKGAELFAKRQQQGLGLRWYFVFYANLLRGMVATVTPHFHRKPDQLQKAVDGLASIVMFELDLASTAYIQSAQEQAEQLLRGTADQFEREVSGLVGMVSASVAQLKSAAETMASVANETAGEAKSATAAAEQTSVNIGTVSSATEELNSSIREIASQVGKSAQIAEGAVAEAQRTNQLVEGLAEAVGKIGDVVKLINDIATQTNLLALNATIEAARAGEAGKGFAVVAGEVKSLANQTAKATDEISAQIAAVQAATRDAVGAIQQIGATIVSINEISTTVASAVEEQGAATQEIARSVQGAAEGGAQVSRTIGEVNRLAGRTDTTAREVSTGVGALVGEADQLTHQVGQFLRKIRAG